MGGIRKSHFHSTLVEYGGNLSFKFASCLLLAFDAVHLPMDEPFLFFPETLNHARKGGGGAGNKWQAGTGRRSRDLYCVCIYLSLSRT